MRRAVFALMMTLLLLCGCGGERDEDVYEQWRQTAAAGAISFDAELTALAGEAQTVYAVHVDHAGGETVLAITAPENIAGISLRCKAGEAELLYDGLVLSLGTAGLGSSDPSGLIPALMDALASRRILRTWREGEQLVVELPLEGDKSLRLCFQRESMTPFFMEATENGQSVVFCNIKNWTMGET